jgi:hypothetical protein
VSKRQKLAGMNRREFLHLGLVGTTFVMPPGSVISELPRPKSPAITLRAVPPHTVAAITFSGFAGAAAIREKTATLRDALQRDGATITSGPWTALYNPPWTPPFMRRNEVMYEIEGEKSGEASRH